MKMKMNTGMLKTGMLCAGLLAATAGAARATTVTMSLSGEPYSTYTYSGDYAGILNGNQIIGNGEWIGIYSFNDISVNPASGPGSISIPSTLYAVCLSPSGVLGGGPVTYTVGPLSGTGQRPGAWANPGAAPNAGILNAYYLFATLSGQIDSGAGIGGQTGGAAVEGTALALAMYTALYNSAVYGDGTLGATGGAFTLPNLSLNSDVFSDYKADLLTLANVNTSLFPAGSVLISPGVGSGGQDMEVMATPIPQLTTAVPEPSTVLAGVLLLLPLGASAYRIIRNRKMAA